MTDLRLVLKAGRIKRPPTTITYDAETIASHLKVHLTGNETLNIHNRWAELGKVKRLPPCVGLSALRGRLVIHTLSEIYSQPSSEPSIQSLFPFPFSLFPFPFSLFPSSRHPLPYAPVSLLWLS